MVIRTEALSKYYRIGNSLSSEGLRSQLRRTLRRGLSRNHAEDYREGQEGIWAVKDVSFEAKEGDVIGIIGRNGSGKSTLLKMLARITVPTSGQATIKGRVGSLLEVGTGFHPLLTGRENIYLNGAMIGIRKDEIRKRFDEIVAFSEVERFLDTPVKHYSSGMFVRLAFSVAAFLETEILLVDEVLAVGDIGFQTKCFERIESLIEKGVTVIFISHSMASVQRLCPLSVLMENGRILFVGETVDAAAHYYALTTNVKEKEQASTDNGITHRGDGSLAVQLVDFGMLNGQGQRTTKICCGDYIDFRLSLMTRNGRSRRLPGIALRIMDNQTQELIANIQTPQAVCRDTEAKGRLWIQCAVQSLNLAPGIYKLEVKIGGDGDELLDIAEIHEHLEITWSKETVDNMSYKGRVYIPGRWEASARAEDE
jgi:lipopolysaccharide transport system ATP-binding protein